MDRDYLRRLRDNETELTGSEQAELLEKAVAEHALLLKHDEEVAVPDDLPEEISRRLSHGRDLALARAADVRDVVGNIVNRVGIKELPDRFQSFHKDYWNTVAKDKTDAAMMKFGFGDEASR
ncbi:hypothetical protein [Hyphomicrobium sp. DY-1]|uniref:hypothetical protein n=1 Tax=Hyphomicrobium sp. DY-1 TaxID=3075650 RepID=UPI0039C02CD8